MPGIPLFDLPIGPVESVAYGALMFCVMDRIVAWKEEPRWGLLLGSLFGMAGAWEDEMLADTRELKRILEQKNIPHWIDIWGGDVNHDWPWWEKMLPYFMGTLNLPAYRG